MRISVILGHPYDKSLNHAIAATVADVLNNNGHDVRLHDMYRENFDPVIRGRNL
ncbi:NAD(P)H-dependent oxidoreductase [Methanolobus halotolerans]|uniref:NAD(P)H-dependent oxidoreductase n=1 Tax=Methanolobus halotolerans TaxID=2052935 RepID=UPI0022A68C84|nr:NAD(P)H-dependent oxidoreductase [Methanolobus halotolerans]